MKPDRPVTFKPETAADVWLGLLAARGVEDLLANGGTDFAPVGEAYAKGRALGWCLPEVVIVPHENLGVAMAHGYTMITGRPQAMMVHVGVGTANAITGIINASRMSVPILVTAGRTPLTESGALPGARDNFIHWAQEHFDQGAMLREFVKWDYELRHAEQTETVLDRALAIAKSEPQGPVYVTLPRELLASSFTSEISPAATIAPVAPAAADAAALEEAAKILGRAENPLIITANGGRTLASSRALARLAHRAGNQALVPMARGRGVRLQRYKDGGLSDVKTFKGAEGLTWVDAGGRVFIQSMKELAAWRGNRGDAGRVRPDRFLTNNKFGQPAATGKGGEGA